MTENEAFGVVSATFRGRLDEKNAEPSHLLRHSLVVS